MSDRHPVVGAPDAYEPPRVERVLTPAEIEREFRYAGDPDGSGPG